MTTENEIGPFKAEDFEVGIEIRLVPSEINEETKLIKYEMTKTELYEWCKEIANARLKEIMKDAPRLYDISCNLCGHCWGENHSQAKHTAQLAPWTIKKIK